MKYKVYEVEVKGFNKDGEAKTMKSLVLQREGAQYPTKNVAMWSDHPLYATIATGQEHELTLIEKDSQTPNPHKAGTFYKNRSVANETTPTVVHTTGLEARVAKLEAKVFPVVEGQNERPVGIPEDDITPSDIPF